MQRITVFDFDGTITTKDSLWEFLKHTNKKNRLIFRLICWGPWFLIYCLKIISAEKSKQKLFEIMFKNWTVEQFHSSCHSFCLKIDQFLNSDTILTLKKHQQERDIIIIISASIEDWIRPWANKQGIEIVLGTQVAHDINHRLTGKFASKNCNGKEKVKRLLKLFPNRSTYQLTVYGNSNGDTEILNFADIGIWINNKNYNL